MERAHNRRLAYYSVALGMVMGAAMVILSLASVLAGSEAQAASGTATDRLGMGPRDAKVQMIVYFDFQCGHCENLHATVEGDLIKQYVDTGKAHLEMRPVAYLGAGSQRAAEAALAAADQGKFFAYRDAVFQAERTIGPTAVSDAGLKDLASQVGLDRAQFDAVFDSGSKLAELQQIMEGARTGGIQYVPTVLVNDQQIVGSKDLNTYVQAIDAELAK